MIDTEMTLITRKVAAVQSRNSAAEAKANISDITVCKFPSASYYLVNLYPGEVQVQGQRLSRARALCVQGNNLNAKPEPVKNFPELEKIHALECSGACLLLICIKGWFPQQKV